MWQSTTLGAWDDSLVEEVELDDDDARAAYVAWAAAVKRYRGYPTTAPHNTLQIAQGEAAAAYPLEVILDETGERLNPIFKRWPDDWSTNGKTGYYRAPEAVLAYTNGRPRNFWDVGTWFGGGDSPITGPQTVPGESAPGDPKWYDDIKSMLKAGGWIVGGLVALTALSYLPRRRD